jgi:hypothetical protein
LGTDGAEAVPDSDGGGGKVLRLRKPKADVPAGICLNFPFGVAGELVMEVRLEPGFQGAHLALSDHYDMPGLPKDGAFALQITAQGRLEVRQADGSLVPTEAVLPAGTWHELRLAWDCAASSAALSLDGKRVAELPRLADPLGVCYLRLRSTAEGTDEAGLYVRRVETQSQPAVP